MVTKYGKLRRCVVQLTALVSDPNIVAGGVNLSLRVRDSVLERGRISRGHIYPILKRRFQLYLGEFVDAAVSLKNMVRILPVRNLQICEKGKNGHVSMFTSPTPPPKLVSETFLAHF